MSDTTKFNSITDYVDTIRDDFQVDFSADPRVSKARRLSTLSPSNRFRIIGLEVNNAYQEFDLGLLEGVSDLRDSVRSWIDEKSKENIDPGVDRRLAIKKLLNGAIQVEGLVPIMDDEVYDFEANIDMSDPKVSFGVQIHRMDQETLEGPKCGSNQLVIDALGGSEVETLLREIQMSLPPQGFGVCFLDISDLNIKFIAQKGRFSNGAIARLVDCEKIPLTDDLGEKITDHIRNSKTVQDLMKQIVA